MRTYRVTAVNTATSHENRIHADEIAAQYGFQQGLVPGVNVYGYMTVPVVESLGQQWLESGWMDVRFEAPFYDGETVVVDCDGCSVTASGAAGDRRARAEIGLGSSDVEIVPAA